MLERTAERFVSQEIPNYVGFLCLFARKMNLIG